MKLKLPNNEVINLDDTLNKEERLKVVDEILAEWKDYFDKTWQLNKTMVCLEILSSYLCYSKDAKDSENNSEKDSSGD